jgi:hypothetical protein
VSYADKPCSKQTKKRGICLGCSKVGTLFTKKFCRSCYDARPERKGTCSTCGKENTPLTAGLCSACYYNRPDRRGICSACGKENTPLTAGMCITCYWNRPDAKRKCSECGKDNTKILLGVCVACYTRKRKYGITYKEFIKALKKQKNKCPICKKKITEKTACIKYNYDIGKINELLCRNCSSLLGHAKAGISTLENAIKYLNKNIPNLSNN